MSRGNQRVDVGTAKAGLPMKMIRMGPPMAGLRGAPSYLCRGHGFQ